MRATYRDVDQAVAALHRAVDRLVAVCDGVPATSPVPPEFRELERREVASRQWIDDPCGYRHGTPFDQYVMEHAL